VLTGRGVRLAGVALARLGGGRLQGSCKPGLFQLLGGVPEHPLGAVQVPRRGRQVLVAEDAADVAGRIRYSPDLRDVSDGFRLVSSCLRP